MSMLLPVTEGSSACFQLVVPQLGQSVPNVLLEMLRVIRYCRWVNCMNNRNDDYDDGAIHIHKLTLTALIIYLHVNCFECI